MKRTMNRAKKGRRTRYGTKGEWEKETYTMMKKYPDSETVKMIRKVTRIVELEQDPDEEQSAESEKVEAKEDDRYA